MDRLTKKCLRDCQHIRINPARNECLHPDAAEWLPDYLDGGKRLYQPTIVEARASGKCGHLFPSLEDDHAKFAAEKLQIKAAREATA